MPSFPLPAQLLTKIIVVTILGSVVSVPAPGGQLMGNLRGAPPLPHWPQEERLSARDALTVIGHSAIGHSAIQWHNPAIERTSPSIRESNVNQEPLELLSELDAEANNPQGEHYQAPPVAQGEISPSWETLPIPRQRGLNKQQNSASNQANNIGCRRGKQRKKLFQCHQCNYASIVRNNLARHRTTHHPERARLKPYRCHQCDYAAVQKCHLSRHLNIHLPARERPKPYRCRQCNYATDRSDGLNQHLKIHAPKGTLPQYRCNQCSYTSTWKSNLNSHLKSHQPKKKQPKIYRCSRCNFTTSYKFNLSRHENQHH